MQRVECFYQLSHREKMKFYIYSKYTGKLLREVTCPEAFIGLQYDQETEYLGEPPNDVNE